ncbi:MAG: hypothetical protein P8H30_00985, partial [Luminiphilus sp.]|nr:hypothetical protein [Luminiphilus sp.]
SVYNSLVDGVVFIHGAVRSQNEYAHCTQSLQWLKRIKKHSYIPLGFKGRIDGCRYGWRCLAVMWGACADAGRS